jgi:cardiolipin synthase A/B
MSELLRVVAEIAAQLSDSLAAPLIKTTRTAEGPASAARSRALARHPSPVYRSAVSRLYDAWEREPMSGSELAGALAGARQTAIMLREEQGIDIVWTGPAHGTLPVRSTREVLIELVRAADVSLVLLSFAAYKNDMILSELTSALNRGVAVWIITESETDAPTAFASIAARIHLYTWPLELRPDVGRKTAVLHAKGVIADDRRAFITSANLTAAALDKNIELGLLVTGGDVPRDLGLQIRELIRSGTLSRLS